MHRESKYERTYAEVVKVLTIVAMEKNSGQ